MSDEPENNAPPPEFSDEAPQPQGQPPEKPKDQNVAAAATKAKAAALAFGGERMGGIIPNNLEELYRLASGVARAGWAPKSYMFDTRKPDLGFDVDRIAFGMMYGMEMGYTPLSALRVIAVINGTPSIHSDGALALCQSTGQMEEFTETPMHAEADGAGYKKGDVIGYECVVVRRGHPKPYSAKFTYDDAKRAGLLDKSGPWKEYRPRMYQMRARSWALRAAFADRLNNLMLTEEAQDMVIEGTATETRPQIEHKPAVNVASALDQFSARREPVGVTAQKGPNDGHDPATKG